MMLLPYDQAESDRPRLAIRGSLRRENDRYLALSRQVVKLVVGRDVRLFHEYHPCLFEGPGTLPVVTLQARCYSVGPCACATPTPGVYVVDRACGTTAVSAQMTVPFKYSRLAPPGGVVMFPFLVYVFY